MPVEVDAEAQEAKATRRLRRSGNSVVVSIPPQLLRQAGFIEGDEVEVIAPFDGGSIELQNAAEESDDDTPAEATAQN